MQIWKLHIEADRYAGFQPDDLSFFADRFECRRMAADWAPPPVTVCGRSKPLPDFGSWMNKSPVVSERARDLVEQLAGADVEFLPFHPLKAKPYFVLNVVRCLDWLDPEHSDLGIAGRFAFRKDLPLDEYPIFKCTGLWDEIFVTSRFGEMMVANALRGASLADPAEPTFRLLLAKAEVNRFPGLKP